MTLMATSGVVVDDADMCACIREMGFDVRSPAEVQALEHIQPTVRRVFPGTGLVFNVYGLTSVYV
jgi:hypothetical protein